MKKLPWRTTLYLVAFLYLFLDLKCCNGPLKRKIAATRPSSAITKEKAKEEGWVALVNREPATRQQLQLAVARHLYQRGKSREEISAGELLQIRRAVLRGLIDDMLIRQYAEGVDFEAPEEEQLAFVQAWEDQFHNERERNERSEYQELSADDRREELGRIWSRKRWLEKRISPGIGVSEDEMKAWFDQNKDNGSFVEPEKRRARHIFISTVEEDSDEKEKQINLARERIINGEDFGEVTAEISEDLRTRDRGGDLNWFSRARLPESFSSVVFSQRPNELGEPFKTEIGWHLVEVTDHQPSRPVSFEDVKEEIRVHLLNQQRAEIVNELLGKLRKVANIVVFTENLDQTGDSQ